MRILFAPFLVLMLASSALAGPFEGADEREPDVYPSQSSATAGLARRLVNALSGSRQFDPDKTSAQICADVNAESLTRLTDTLRDEFPSLRFEEENPAQAAEGKSLLRIELELSAQEPIPSPFRTRRDLTKGAITLVASGDGINQSLTARYVDKPWVDDWASFANAETKGRWITGKTEIPDPSEAVAWEEARKAAAKALWPLVQKQMNARNAKRSDVIMVKENWVRSKLEVLLRQDEHVTDRFIQSFDRSSLGTTWQAAILVDASSDDIDSMASHCSRLARAEFGAKAVTLGSMAGMVGVIVLLYFFVNAVTKGYFVWRLRAVALLLGIVGILIVLAVR